MTTTREHPPEVSPLGERALGKLALEQQALGERDRRAAETAALLSAGSRAVVRLSARMPAILRQRGLAAAPTERGAAVFESACRERGFGLAAAGEGDGVLGPWRLWTSDADPVELKRAALYIEEGSWLGQLLDLDVAGPGGLVGRSELCLPPRTCVVCGGTATACSGRAMHPAATVEAAFATLLARATGGHHPGSPDGSAVGVHPSLHIREIDHKGGDTP